MEHIIEKIQQKNAEIERMLQGKTVSVSACNTYLAPEFEKEKVANKLAATNFNNPKSKYYQKTAEQIISEWEAHAEESKKYGRLLDDYIGLYLTQAPEKDFTLWKLNNNFEYDERLKDLCAGFHQFYDALISKTNYRYVTREMKMYIKSNIDGRYANGRFDCLFFDETNNKYLIIDWKSSDKIELKNDYNKKLYGPCFNLDACDGNKYTIQLQMYKKALCETYGLANPENVEIFICHMHRYDNNPKLYWLIKENFPYQSRLIDQIIEFSNKRADLENLK